MEFIRDFYFGELFPWEKGFSDKPAYMKTMRCMEKSKDKLAEYLDADGIKLFDDFWEKECKFIGEAEFENFRHGFSLGVRMMCDCFYGDNK